MTIIVYIGLLLLASMMFIPSKVNSIYYYLLLAYMILLSGFRYDVGSDYFSYENSFSSGDHWYSDFLFITLVDLFKYMGLSAQTIFFILALITQIFIVLSIKKFCKTKETIFMSLFLYIFLYYFIDSMNLVRQFLALSIFFYNLDNVINKRFFRYILFSLLVIMIHQSAALFIVIYWIPKVIEKVAKTKIRRIILLSISFLLVFVRFDELIKFIIIELNLEKYQYYALWGADEFLNYNLSWQLLLLLIGKFILYFYVSNNKNKITLNQTELVLFNIFFFGALLTLPLYPMLIFRRLLFYINIVEIIVLSTLAVRVKYARLIIIIFALSFFVISLLSNYSQPLPYKINTDIFINE